MDSKPEIQEVTELNVEEKLAKAKEEMVNISKSTPFQDYITENPKTAILAAVIAGVLIGTNSSLRESVGDEMGKQAVKAAMKNIL